MNSVFPILHLYTRKPCCLCEDMERDVLELLTAYTFDLVVHDIDSQADWLQRYDTLVPVLSIEKAQQEQEICHYFLDLEAAKTALQSS